MSTSPEEPYDRLRPERGKRESYPLATTVFIGLRALDGFVVQRALQVLDPIGALCRKLNVARPLAPPSGGASLSVHGLTPYQAAIWGMSIVAALKQIGWHVFISKEPIAMRNVMLICCWNFMINGVNTLAFSVAGSNPTWHPYLVPLGSALFASGILLETVSEVQRCQFKDKPENEGKPYSGGLFGYARSINYLGYGIWRSSFALAAGGVVFGPVQFGFWAWVFVNVAIPQLDSYCSFRYGKQWDALKQKVPHCYIPGII